MVRTLGVVQAQDARGAMWGIGQRVSRATEGSVGRALDEGKILRTHVLRPTWHFVAPADIRWMLALTGPRLIASTARRRRELGLDATTLPRALAAIERALAEGPALTRRELAARLERTRIDPSGQRLPYLLMYGELSALLCSGPRKGSDHTYTLLDRVVPDAPDVDREAALAELATRYVAGHGPATLADLSWWSGLGIGDCRTAVELAGDAIRTQVVDGLTFLRASGSRRARAARPKARLLPNFDEYFIAYKERAMYGDALGTTPWPPAIVGGHTVVIEGLPVGTWRRQMIGEELVVTVTLARRIARGDRAEIEAAAEGLGRYLRMPVRRVEISRSSASGRS